MMNPDEHHQENNNILKYSPRTQQHSDDQNVHPDFQVKASGAQDTWHKTIGHPSTATRAQELYK
jgi:hypothetical protein